MDSLHIWTICSQDGSCQVVQLHQLKINATSAQAESQVQIHDVSLIEVL
jgi:hypothetical protein